MTGTRSSGRSTSAWRSRSGQALVEFALVVPLLLLLVVGVMEFGRAWNAHQVITDAAREAARTAAIHDLAVSADSVRAVVLNALTRAALDPGSAEVAVDGVDHERGHVTTVTIDYPYDFKFLGGLMGWIGADRLVTLSTSCSMRNE